MTLKSCAAKLQKAAQTLHKKRTKAAHKPHSKKYELCSMRGFYIDLSNVLYIIYFYIRQISPKTRGEKLFQNRDMRF